MLAVISAFLQTSLDYIRFLPAATISLDTEFVSQAWAKQQIYSSSLWWLAWAPFVGTFSAIISRGRTLRAFLSVIILLPTVLSLFWFSIFGAIPLTLTDTALANCFSEMVLNDRIRGLFIFFEHFTAYPQLFALGSMLLLCTLMITSSDSACYTIAYHFEQYDIGRSKRLRAIWCAIVALITLVLIWHNQIKLNYTFAILGAIPFALIFLMQLAACFLLLFRHCIQKKVQKKQSPEFTVPYDPFLKMLVTEHGKKDT